MRSNVGTSSHTGSFQYKREPTSTSRKKERAKQDTGKALPPVPKFPSFPPFESFATPDCDLPGASSAVHASAAAPEAEDEDAQWYCSALTTGVPRLPQYPRSVWRAEKHRIKENHGMQYCYNPFLDTAESFHEHPFSLPREWTHDQVDCAVARAVGKAERERSEKAQEALAK